MPDKLLVDSLTKRFGEVEAVRGVSFAVREGEIFGLLGPNGAGKTTTIDCIVGLRSPDSGRVMIGDVDARQSPEEIKQRIGVALQSTALQDKITPREALHLFGSFYCRHAKPQQLIERFFLGEKADAPFATLSAGQKQRLALALAFVNEPELIFLDEPTAGLDAQARRELHADILRMRGDGRTVVLTTHYIEEAETLCDNVAIIDHGRIIAAGKPAALVARSKALPQIVVSASRALDADRIGRLPNVTDVHVDRCTARCRTTSVSQTIIDLVKMLQTDGNELLDLHIHQPSLEDVFIELTGQAIRDSATKSV